MLAAALALLLGGHVNAAVILSNTAGTNTLGGSGYEGHSFTMPAGPSYNNITWSWVSSNQSTLLAAGNLVLLTQEYLGSPNGLSAATPGFVAKSTGIVSSAYVFAPGVTLNPSTQYWVYMDGAASLAGGGYTFSDPFPGGKAYEQFSSPANNYFNNGANLDFNFVLSGQVGGVAAIPEPASIAVFGVMALTGAFYGIRRRRQAAV